MTVDAAIQNDKDATPARPETAAGAVAPVVGAGTAGRTTLTDGNSAQLQNQPRPPVEFLGIALPDPVSRGIHYVGDKVQDARRKTIEFLPGAIVNRSSNIISTAQLTGEFMMFQASAKEPLVKNPHNPVSWIFDPPRIILSETFRKTQGGTKLKDIFHGNPVKNFYTRLTDVKAATDRERALQRAASKVTLLDHEIKLPNRWQARSTFSGLIGWGVNILLPDPKDTPEEIEKMTNLATQSPLKYVGTRLFQAVWIPGWWDHKRQFTGLTVMASGVFSMVGAWRNREKIVPDLMRPNIKLEKFKLNRGYFMTGLCTFASSIPLLFRVDNDRGYANWGEIQASRLLFYYPSISQKVKNDEPGLNWYLGGIGAFQTTNLIAAMLGGAEKRADGTIVDHKAIREQAKRKALIAKAEQPPSKHGFWREEVAETPQPRIQKSERSAVEHTPPVQAVANQKV